MPIYEQTFRPYEGKRYTSFLWWPIAWQTFKRILKSKITYVILMGAVANVIYWSVGLFIAAQLYRIAPEKAQNLDEVSSQISGIPLFGQKNQRIGTIFFQFLQGEYAFLWILILLTGGALISADKRFNALPLYFSRPLTPRSYMFGKVLGLSMFPALVLIASLLLLYLQLGGYFFTLWQMVKMSPLMMKGCLYVVVICLMTSLSMAAFSSLTSNSRIAAVSYLGFWVLTTFLGRAIARVAKQSEFGALSPGRSLEAISLSLFQPDLSRYNEHHEMPAMFDPSLAWVSIIAYTLLFLWILRRNLRVVEVVK